MTGIKIGVNMPAVDELASRGRTGAVTARRHGDRWTSRGTARSRVGVSVGDAFIGDSTSVLDSIIALAFAAAATERVGLGFRILVPSLRPVAWVAVQIATLQHLTDDRAIVGIGSGGFTDARRWPAVGVDQTQRGQGPTPRSSSCD